MRKIKQPAGYRCERCTKRLKDRPHGLYCKYSLRSIRAKAIASAKVVAASQSF